MKDFSEFDIDTRIISALKKIGWNKPTPIQEQVFKVSAEGKDIIGSSRTGSGKTGAYLIPIVNKILKSLDSFSSGTVKAIILVPTKELSSQVYTEIQKLVVYCSKEVKVLNLVENVQIMGNGADVLIGTPSKVVKEIQSKRLVFNGDFQSLVIDEADLIFSYGYEEDLTKIVSLLPSVFQTFLLSATMVSEIETLKKMFIRNPVTIDIQDTVEASSNLTQYTVECKENDKFLFIYFLLKLKLIKGKCIIFVKNIDRCYQVKLFLEQFGIKSCVLNSELPFNSRYHLVQQFNYGVYEYLIATDESDSFNEKKDGDYGVSRGIDFQNVEAVINFDFPAHSKSYTHRIGRTARGESEGTAFSFVTEEDRKILKKVEYKQKQKKREIIPYNFDMRQVDAFRYRCEDALKHVSKSSIKDARIKEVQQEILHSEKLKTHFKVKPNDLHALRHDKALHTARVQPHLKHVPDYLLPEKVRRETKVSEFEVTFHSGNDNKKRKRAYHKQKAKDVLKNVKAKRSRR